MVLTWCSDAIELVIMSFLNLQWISLAEWCGILLKATYNIRIHKETTGEGVWGRVRWKFSHHFKGGTNNGGRLTPLVF